MLLVKTKLGPSTIEGVGLFAAERIPKGTVIWRFGKNLDQSFPTQMLDGLPEAARAQILHYAYHNKKTGEYVLCFDDARFFNHSEIPNTAEDYSTDPIYGTDMATRDIEIGEELTTDYQGFDEDTKLKLEGGV